MHEFSPGCATKFASDAAPSKRIGGAAGRLRSCKKSATPGVLYGSWHANAEPRDTSALTPQRHDVRTAAVSGTSLLLILLLLLLLLLLLELLKLLLLKLLLLKLLLLRRLSSSHARGCRSQQPLCRVHAM